MKTINPYLIFNGNTTEAFTFYQSVFGGEPKFIKFKDMPGTGNMTEDDQNKIAHVSLPIDGDDQILMASDATANREVEISDNGNFYITLEPENTDEAKKIYDKLSENGRVIMPLDATDWAEKFAMFADKFGVQWMISYTGNAERK